MRIGNKLFKNVVLLCLLLAAILMESCGNQDDIKIQLLAVESDRGGQPFLASTDDGEVYMSWVEYANDTLVNLQFSKLENDLWSAPKPIASGSDWFVNWADFPSINIYRGGGDNLVAHWLEMSAEGTYDYDVHLSQSNDGGQNWSPSIIPHNDGISAEHGFVSMSALSDKEMVVTWLDGRNTKATEAQDDDHGHGHGAGAMTLRTAILSIDGSLSEEKELDSRVCDCCQTSTATNENGDIYIVYRDRSEEEVRDIAITRKINGKWMPSTKVYNDNWNINGCPVNGPVVSATDDKVAVAWFSMRDSIAEVKVAFSDDRGANFDLPVRLDRGHAMGRVDLLFLEEDKVLVSWMEQQGDNALILAQTVDLQGNKGEVVEVATTSSKRTSGFPRMVRDTDDVVMAWTVLSKYPSVMSARVRGF